MGVRKLSVAIEESVAGEASRAAKADGVSLSQWLTGAAEDKLRVVRGLEAVREWEREHGVLSKAALRRADAMLDKAFASGRPTPKRVNARSRRKST